MIEISMLQPACCRALIDAQRAAVMAQPWLGKKRNRYWFIYRSFRILFG
jgi:hypothetical protein